ncbi:hypothetical protein GCM10023334_102270 [Nonomuraea thailandensis]
MCRSVSVDSGTDRRTGKTTIVIIYAITSLPPGRIAHTRVAALIRGHGSIGPCTISATSPTAKTPAEPGPEQLPASWLACAP